MILGLSMKARMGLSKFIVIIPKTTFGVLNFVFQRARERWGCFGGMRSDGEKDGSDPILTRRHFAERLGGTGKM